MKVWKFRQTRVNGGWYQPCLSLKVASALNVKVMEIPTRCSSGSSGSPSGGDEQRGLARDAEVRHSGARSHRLRAETSAARPRRALRHLSIHFFPASHCGAFCRTMEQRRPRINRRTTTSTVLTATATVTLSLRACLFLCYSPVTSPAAAEAAQRLRLDEEQEEHGQERLAL